MTTGANAPTWVGWPADAARLLWRDPVARRRAWIVCAAVFVCAYAVGVLGYVLLTPEIGVRCAFTPVVNHFYDEFHYPGSGPMLQPDDRIVEVGGHRVQNWPQLLRAMNRLRGERPDVVDRPEDLQPDPDGTSLSFVLLDGERLVRVV